MSDTKLEELKKAQRSGIPNPMSGGAGIFIKFQRLDMIIDQAYQLGQQSKVVTENENASQVWDRAVEACAKAIESDCWNDPHYQVNQKAMAFNTAKFIRNHVKPQSQPAPIDYKTENLPRKE